MYSDHSGVKGIIIGFAVGSVMLVSLLTMWYLGGFATGVWIDGCPDVVAAHEPSPA
jgi:hypothetical protein